MSFYIAKIFCVSVKKAVRCSAVRKTKENRFSSVLLVQQVTPARWICELEPEGGGGGSSCRMLEARLEGISNFYQQREISVNKTAEGNLPCKLISPGKKER